MVIKIDSEYFECAFCHKRFKNPLLAHSCEKSHKLIYVPLTMEDLKRLVQFIFTHDDNLLNTTMVKTLMDYSNRKEIVENDLSDMQ
jgi:hypothetical protein